MSIIEKINKSALRFLVPLTLENTYETIVDEAVKLVGAMYGSIVLEQNGELVRVLSSSPIAYKTVNRRRGFTHESFKEKKVIVVDISEIGQIHPELIEAGIKTTIFIPMSYRRKPIGVLTVNLASKPKGLGEHLDVLKLFGSMASLAIRKAQLSDETKKTLEIRDLFLSMAAHELRTPLTTITVYLELLKKKVGQMQDQTLIRWSDELSSEAHRLSLLINELLVVNRIKSGELQYVLKTCNLKDILNRAFINFSSTYPNRIIDYKDCVPGDNAYIIGDFDKLIQVFINIFGNAAKFSSSNTNVIVELDRQKNDYIVKIQDLGKGIPKEDMQRVFEGFYKGQSHMEGMGIGLFLAKNIIDKHRGEISIRSRLNQGTVVKIKLPETKV